MTDVINARQGLYGQLERTQSAKERRRATTTLCRTMSSATLLLTFHSLVQADRSRVYIKQEEIIFFIKSTKLFLLEH